MVFCSHAPVITLILTLLPRELHSLTQKIDPHRNFPSSRDRCKPPSIEPFHEQVKSTKIVAKALKCSLNDTLYPGMAFNVEYGKYLQRLKDIGICCWKQISYDVENDESSTSQDCAPILVDLTDIPASVEYIAVECRRRKANQFRYLDAFPIIHHKLPLLVAKPPKLNIMVLIIDSSSQLNFQRTMPKSYNFITKKLGGFTLAGYNIVGECTHSNLIPLLTGKSSQMFYESCVQDQEENKNGSVNLDGCEFIWEKFAKRGYLTSYLEDFSQKSPIYSYWQKPFRESSTHYTLRPVAKYFWRLAGKYFKKEEVCLGPKFSLQVLLDTMKTIAVVNKNKATFQIGLTRALSYNSQEDQARGDSLLLEFLLELRDQKLLNSTAIFILGDHGSLQKEFRQTKTGAIEHIMPTGLMVLPPWFQKSYPVAYRTLTQNSRKMVTPFDMHKTLLDLTNFRKKFAVPEANETGRSESSLFRSISGERRCLQAGIPLTWCIPCHPSQPLAEDVINETAQFLMSKLDFGRYACASKDMTKAVEKGNISFENVIRASKWHRKDVQSELCSMDGSGVLLRGYFRQSNAVLKIPCDSVSRAKFEVDVVQIEILTKGGETCVGQVVRYWNGTDRRIHMQLTEEPTCS